MNRSPRLTNLTCKANDSYDPRRMRSDDISCLYETNSWDVASEIIAQYDIRYVVIGTLERRDYHINELSSSSISTRSSSRARW